MDAKTLIEDWKRRAYGDDAAKAEATKQKGEPLGEMLPNGFRVGEEVEHYSTLDNHWERVAIVRPHPAHVAIADANAAVFKRASGAAFPYGWDPLVSQTREPLFRRLSPPAQPESASEQLGALVKELGGTWTSYHQPVALPGGAVTYAKPAAPLCPCCRDTPLRLVGEAQDVYRCGHCSWTGSAEKLAAAVAESRVFDPGPGDPDCPACDGELHMGHHGIYECCRCSWKGGPLLAAAKREACKPKMRFKVGDRVHVQLAHIAFVFTAQVMELVDGGYVVADYMERAHNVSEADLQPWPAEAP